MKTSASALLDKPTWLNCHRWQCSFGDDDDGDDDDDDDCEDDDEDDDGDANFLRELSCVSLDVGPVESGLPAANETAVISLTQR